MSDPQEPTFATRFLNRNPQIRQAVADTEEFILWKNQLPTKEIDGVIYYLRGGPVASDVPNPSNQSAFYMNPGADQLQEQDELILEWAIAHGWVSEKELNQSRLE
ncbi:MAG: hypothetical protein M3O33_23565 [Cyanobacteriota bacterium]|nr:hypothetical protein [Cyanobacteriota bacterium]